MQATDLSVRVVGRRHSGEGLQHLACDRDRGGFSLCRAARNVAAVIRAAGRPKVAAAPPPPTMPPTTTPTVTPTVPPPSGVIWRKYYFAGAERVAMRVSGDPVQANNGVFYLLGDHLRSTNVLVEEDGTPVSEQLYRAASRSEAEG